MNLSIVTEGSYLHVHDGMIEVELEGRKQRISPRKVERITINTRLRLTSDLIVLALKHNIDILFLDEFGNPAGRVWLPTFGSTSRIRLAQLRALLDGSGLEYARSWIADKLSLRKAFLTELASRRPTRARKMAPLIARHDEALAGLKALDIREVGAADSMRGIEGNCGRNYFTCLALIQPAQFPFEGRSSRPARDPFNCLLNYGYGVLYSHIEKACVLAGLDPHVGFLHRNDYNQRSFVFDFIEPYRVAVERVIVSLFSTKKINAAFFEPLDNGVRLQKEGKKLLLSALADLFEAKVRHRSRQVELKHHIQLDAHHFAQTLLRKEAACSSG